ncbi:MAG TPA: hypothetical protein VN461_23230 [Vicinamibacteria bacterium]|nr:hypothetical protein [Vicinamibacteria bacterium]
MKYLRQSLHLALGLSSLAFTAPPAAPSDLCQGLVLDKLPHPLSSLTQPAVGQTVVDPEFGGTVRRITAAGSVPGSDAAIVPIYSTISAWNADESRLLLYHVGRGHELYDGRSYRFLRSLDIAPNDIEQVYWHTTDPDVLFYLSGKSLLRYHVSSDTRETVHSFNFCSGPISGGSDPMFTSWDSNTIGLKCDSTVFVYQIGSDAVTGMGTTTLDAPQASASGARVVMDGWVLDPGLNVQRKLDLASPYEHASQGQMTNGHDTYETVAFDPGPAGSGLGSLVSFDLTDGSSRVVVGPSTGYPYPPSGTHVSALDYRNPGWVFLSIVGNPSGAGVLDNEIVIADTNTGRVCRAAHHRSFGNNNTHLSNNYWAEPHVVASPSGTRAIFGSDWGNGFSVDTYVLELPSDLGLRLGVSTDKSRYATKSSLSASLSITNIGRAAQVDLLLFEVLPDGDQVVLLTPQGPKRGRLSQPSSLVPVAAGVDLSAPFQLNQPFLTYTWTGSETPGTYAWVLAAVRPGSLLDNLFEPGDVLASASAVFTFSP